MSYDLRVFGRDVGLPELRHALEHGDLTVEQDDSSSLTVVRGKRRRYSFTVGTPVGVDPEDVPEEVIAAVLGPTHMVELLVEGSAPSEISHAIRAARRVAAAMDGAALDPQTDEVFHRGRTRLADRVERGLVSVVEVRWYVKAKEVAPGQVARAYVAAARRHLPEAMPRRYGSFEPLQERCDPGNVDAFVSFVDTAADSVLMRGTHPVHDASIGRARNEDDVVYSCRMLMLAAPPEDERWRLSLERMFVEIAQAIDAIYASAEILRGIEWSGRALWYGAHAEHATYLAGRGVWQGLPPYPVWLSWFGREYAPLIRHHLTGEATLDGGGFLHRQSTRPADRDALTASTTPPATNSPDEHRGWFGLRRRRAAVAGAQPWLPLEYLAVPVDRGPRAVTPPHPAPVVPGPLMT